jgi:hypothetical protein
MTDPLKTAGWPERTWRNLYSADVARGIVPGASIFVGFAETEFNAEHEEAPLWETSMPHVFTPPSGIRLSVVSTSALDTGVIRLVYLDANLDRKVESIVLSGLTPVLTVATDVHAILTVYSLGVAVAGSVTLTHNGTTFAVIPAGSVQFNTGIQRVPSGYRLMIHSMFAGATSGSAAARVTVGIYTSMVEGESFQSAGPVFPVAKIGLQDNSTSMSGFPPLAIPSGEWIGLYASCDKAANVTAGLFGWLEKDYP